MLPRRLAWEPPNKLVNPSSPCLRVLEDSGIDVLFLLIGSFFGRSNPPLKVCPIDPKYAQAVGQILPTKQTSSNKPLHFYSESEESTLHFSSI